ncbi:MAG TPA: diiron oxygenase [Polyangiaceae bacterium]|nr:diiron oxygenase [Polyangiaceae bacterium]
MTLQHNYSYKATLQDSLKVNWRVDDLIGGDKTLDFTKPFLPESLVRVEGLPSLSPRERLTLNQIRGASYLHVFGLVEEFILPFAVERARDGIHASKDRVRALLTFAEEEAKHQQLFQRFSEEFRRGFPTPIEYIGPATAIAENVLANSPLSVGILILHLEWLTQRHYLESIKTDQALDPQFVSLLKHHWQEEAQHAKLDTLVVEELASRASPAEIEKAVEDFLTIGATLEGGLQQQLAYDLDGLERFIGRKFSTEERIRISAQQLPSYRWTFLVSGLEQENFVRAIRDLSPAGLERVQATARALS